MKISKEDKILFVFSDPGGAKPLLSFIAIHKLKNYRVISDRVYSFYKDFGITVHPFNGDTNKEIDSYNPDKVFTGTSYTSDIEKEFILCAKKKGIATIAFVDHWTNISKRFLSKDQTYILPDEIWVLDERACGIAVKEGIPREILITNGNPYHDWLKGWKPPISKTEFLQSIGMDDPARKLLLYAPDPLTNIEGLKNWGFDEYTATKELYDYKEKNPGIFKGWKILIKAHPNQNITLLSDLVFNNNDFILDKGMLDTNLCIYYSDLVLGFFSSILVEANLLGKPVLRYIPTGANFDPLKKESVGKVLSNIGEMEKYLQ